MSWRHDVITDLDLMAYADEQLDAARRQAVEAHLAANPDDALMVEAIARQNEALRASLSAIADEPVPERLTAVLEREPRSFGRPLAQAAALAGLVASSGLGGWWLGQDRPAPTPPAFLAALSPELQAEAQLQAEGALDPLGAVPANAGEPVLWRAEQLALKLVAPSLGAGFSSPELQRLVEIDGRPTVRFALDGPEGHRLSLYLQTRPAAAPAAVRLVDDGGATAPAPAAYWQDGPLAWALTGDAAGPELETLARTIAAAIELELNLGSGEAEITEDAAGDATLQLTADEGQPAPLPLALPEGPVLTPLPITLVGG